MPIQLATNPDGTLTQTNPDGSTSIVMDPDGSYRQSVSQTPAPILGAAQLQPQAQAAPPALSDAGKIVSAVNGQAAAPVLPQAPPPPVAPKAPYQAPNAAPAPGIAISPQRPASEISATSGQHTEGLDEASKKDINQSYAKAEQASNEAANVHEGVATDIAHGHQELAQKSYALHAGKQAAALQAQQDYSQAYDAAMKERSEARARKIDPSQALAGDAGSYAMMATIGAAIANVGRAWMGQSMQPITIIDDLVNRSINLQIHQQEQDVAGAGERADIANARRLEARSDAHEAAAQMADDMARFAGSQDEMKAARAIAADQRAKAAAADVDRAKALATHKVISSQTEIKTQTGGPQQAQYVIPGNERAAQDQRVLHDAAAQAYPDLKPEERQKRVEEFAEKKGAHAATAAQLDKIQAYLDKVSPEGKTNDVPGYGPIAGRLPNGAVSEEGRTMRQLVEPLMYSVEKTELGSKMPQETREKYMDAILGAKDNRSFRRALARLRLDLDEDDHALQNGYPQLYNAQRYIERRQSDERAQSGAGYAQQEAEANR